MTVEDNIIERVIDDLDRTVDLKSWRDSVIAFNKTSPVIKKGLATMPVKFGISFNRPRSTRPARSCMSTWTAA